jgi:hypothetical protein
MICSSVTAADQSDAAFFTKDGRELLFGVPGQGAIRYREIAGLVA